MRNQYLPSSISLYNPEGINSIVSLQANGTIEWSYSWTDNGNSLDKYSLVALSYGIIWTGPKLSSELIGMLSIARGFSLFRPRWFVAIGSVFSPLGIGLIFTMVLYVVELVVHKIDQLFTPSFLQDSLVVITMVMLEIQFLFDRLRQ